MPTALPYLSSYKNVEKCFAGIAAAKIPDAFTHSFLYDTLGLKSVEDRKLMPILRNMGFLDASNKPTPSYQLLKNPSQRKSAIAAGIELAYKPLFDANEDIANASNETIKGLIGQVSGQDEGMVSKITGTFNSLIKLADFSKKSKSEPMSDKNSEEDESEESNGAEDKKAGINIKKASGADPTFHFNIQVHLPSSSTEEVYLNIFNAIRKVFS